MKKRQVLVFLLMVIVIYPVIVQSKSHSDAKELFGGEEEIEVIVVLKDDYKVLEDYGIKSYSYTDDLEMKKMMIGKQQEKFLQNLDYEDVSTAKNGKKAALASNKSKA